MDCRRLFRPGRVVAAILIAAIGLGCCIPNAEARRKRSRRKVARVTKVRYSTPATTGKMSPADPFVVFDRDEPITKGLEGRIIALWQSHGLYFNQTEQRWSWQRPQLFSTVEDLFAQGFVMPYLMPMLENAGAYVMSPRERDLSTTEIIADTDGSFAGDFYMTEGEHKWEEGAHGSGFALPNRDLRDWENPFAMGTSEVVKTVGERNASQKSTASWNVELPARGRYAVYVSYASFPNSATDADYTINHLGGSAHVKVNQQMGGGTWIYLGHYDLAKGKQSRPVVELTNVSGDKDAVVSADAVKVGGGMGNVARSAQGSGVAPCSSGSPRYTEGARYWLQWAGMPPSVYSESLGANDYTDDYKSRALWVNYLAGGSPMLPDSAGLKIPVDMAFAFHTDAGIANDGAVVGTLGIYSTDDGYRLGNNRSRSECGDLARDVIGQVVSDLRSLHRSDWTFRGIRDRKYYEIRATKVPAVIMELLSHQNFEDMKYGLDPAFRFDVARAVYKGMLKFLSKRYGNQYVVQPLPVGHFAITAGGNGRYRLSWRQTVDPLEHSAYPKYYIVEERINGGAFRKIATVKESQYDLHITDNHIHSYRILAGNDGGLSFPSEVLALYDNGTGRPDVMIVNGFTRVSAPDYFNMGEYSGFDFRTDGGVADVSDIITTGIQYDFWSASEYRNNDIPGHGASHGDLAGIIIAGNTHDFVWQHGRAVKAAGKGFVSSGVDAFIVDMPASSLGSPANPLIVDLILGKQKEISSGNGSRGTKFKAIPAELQLRLGSHFMQGGALLVSGAYIGSDLMAGAYGSEEDKMRDRNFAMSQLGFTWELGQASVDGNVSVVPSPLHTFHELKLTFCVEPSPDCYVVESPDALRQWGPGSFAIMKYDENGMTAATAMEREPVGGGAAYKVVALGFPFEAIESENCRNTLMSDVIGFFNGVK